MQRHSSTIIDKDTRQSATSPVANNVRDQEPTEVGHDRYYEYDLDLIQAILHNGSLAGIKNLRPFIKHSSSRDEVTSTHCAYEELTMTDTKPTLGRLRQMYNQIYHASIQTR